MASEGIAATPSHARIATSRIAHKGQLISRIYAQNKIRRSYSVSSQTRRCAVWLCAHKNLKHLVDQITSAPLETSDKVQNIW